MLIIISVPNQVYCIKQPCNPPISWMSLLGSMCCPSYCSCRSLSPALLIKTLLDCFTISTLSANDNLGSLALANGANRKHNGVDCLQSWLGQSPRPHHHGMCQHRWRTC